MSLVGYLPTTHNAVREGGMDLTSPLHSLIPRLDSAVLEVLAGTESSLSLARPDTNLAALTVRFSIDRT